jgi:hypothetical protein
MGCKTINGRRYFYKSERQGRRVKTTFTSSDVAPAVRLRASLAVLQANDALKLDQPCPTSVEAVQSKMEYDKFIESLAG